MSKRSSWSLLVTALLVTVAGTFETLYLPSDRYALHMKGGGIQIAAMAGCHPGCLDITYSGKTARYTYQLGADRLDHYTPATGAGPCFRDDEYGQPRHLREESCK